MSQLFYQNTFNYVGEEIEFWIAELKAKYIYEKKRKGIRFQLLLEQEDMFSTPDIILKEYDKNEIEILNFNNSNWIEEQTALNLINLVLAECPFVKKIILNF